MKLFQTFIKIIKSKVVNNFLNLGIIQVAELVLPLITFPYVVRTIGFEKVGVIAFATAVISYFGILINYGFNLTATKQISQNSADKSTYNEIFFNVIWTKVFLIIVSFTILNMLFIIPKLRFEALIYFLLFGNVVFQNLIPTWFLQGMQDLNFSTKLTLTFKVVNTLLIFLFVKEVDDYWIIALLPFVATALSFLAIIYYINKRYELRFVQFKFNSALAELDSGKLVFLSQLKTSLFNNFNILILGFILNDKAVGIFSSADKIIKLISSLQIPIVSALYPYFSKTFKDDFVNGIIKLKKISLYGSIIYAALIIMTFFLAPFVSQLLFGSHVSDISLLVRIMLIIPLFVFLNNLYGTQLLLNVDQDNVFLKNILIAAIFNVICIIPLTYLFNMNGTAISVLLTEFIVFYLMRRSAYIYIKKHNAD